MAGEPLDDGDRHPERPKTDPSYCAVAFVHVAYDVEAAARTVEASPLPDAFARMRREAR